MPNVIYSMGGVSADGYVVGPDGRFDWSVPDEELHQFHNEQTRAQRHPLRRSGAAAGDLKDASVVEMPDRANRC